MLLYSPDNAVIDLVVLSFRLAVLAVECAKGPKE